MFKSRIFLGCLAVVAFVSSGWAFSGTVWSEVRGDTAYVHHDDAYFNCCPDSIFEIVRQADTIDIFEIDNGSHPCHCTCYFDFTHRIEGLEPGTYLARVWEKQPGEDAVLAGTTSFTIIAQVGSFAALHHISECHEGINENPSSQLELKEVVTPALQSSVCIKYSLPQEAQVRIEIYGVTGSLVRVFEPGVESAGEHTVIWNTQDVVGRRCSRGVYFVRLAAAGEVKSLPLVILR